MARSTLALALLVVLLALAGCQEAGPGGGPGTSAMEYRLAVTVVDESPENGTRIDSYQPDPAVVDASDPTIADVEPIQRALADAESVAIERRTTADLDEDTYERLREVFADLPTYGGDDRGSRAVYVRHEGRLYELWLDSYRPG